MAKTSKRVRQARPAKYKTREYSRCRRCGRPRAVLPQVRHLPDLPAGARPQRVHPRHDQVQLVRLTAMSMTDPDRRLPHADPQRHHRRPRDRRDPVVEAQARDGPDPARAGLHRRLRASRRPTRTARASSSRIRLKYTDDRRSAISGLRRVSRPGQRRYVAARRDPEGPGRHGHRDRLDVAAAS